MANNDEASHQLENWQEEHSENPKSAKNQNGRPYDSLTTCLTAGRQGPPLLQDTCCVELIQNYVRKNPPARIVHEKGTGVHGYFQLTNPVMSKYSKACIFQQVGKKIEVFCRFATPDESGRAESSRIFWAMSMKFYTEEGNQDFLCLNLPVFHVRDPINFVNFHQSAFANPQAKAGFLDQNASWDYVVGAPESVHFYTLLFSDRGLPLSFRHINSFPINIYKMVNDKDDWVYARFQFKTDQGIKFLTSEEASQVRMKDQDFASRDLHNAIARGDYPSFTWYVQIMPKNEPPKFLQKKGWNPFDNTKVWPQSEFPLVEIGKIVFNKNMDNFFNESVLSAFNPANLIPGIEAAMEDQVFTGRIFAYNDAQLYRLGGNKAMVRVNRPKNLKTPLKTYYAGCPMNFGAGHPNIFPNYYPNLTGKPIADGEARKVSIANFDGTLDRFDSRMNDNFSQPKNFYENVLQEKERRRLAKNIAKSVFRTDPNVQKKVFKLWRHVSEDLAKRISEELEKIEY